MVELELPLEPNYPVSLGLVDVPCRSTGVSAEVPKKTVTSVHLFTYGFGNPWRWLLLHSYGLQRSMLVKDFNKEEVECFQLVVWIIKNVQHLPWSSGQIIFKIGPAEVFERAKGDGSGLLLSDRGADADKDWEMVREGSIHDRRVDNWNIRSAKEEI